MMQRFLAASILIIGLAASAVAHAQASLRPAPDESEVVVRGQPAEAVAQAFARAVARAPMAEDQSGRRLIRASSVVKSPGVWPSN